MSMPCDTSLCDPDKCTETDCTGLQLPLEKVYVSSPSFSLPNRHLHTNNTFINRYLESRKPSIPGTVHVQEFKQLSDWADKETIKRLREDMEHYAYRIEDVIDK